MPKIWRSDFLYDLLRRHVDMTTRLCFSTIKVEGRQNYPDLSKYNVVFASNHVNTLMDPLVIMQDHFGATAFGARADIFRKPAIASLLRWLRVVPLARERDGISSIRENFNIFSEVVECLGHGTPFCLFVEGTHYPGYEVHPAKHGIFHIVQSASQDLDKPVLIVPVGLSYNDFYHFKNKVRLSYGDPVRAEEILALPNRDRSSRLTALIQAQVEDLSSWGERKIGGAALTFLRVVAAPLLALCAVFGAPIWVPAEILVSKRKDKAWSNTMRYLTFFALLPLLTIIVAVLGFCLLKWYCAVGCLLVLWLAPRAFYSLIKLYR